MDNSSWLWLVLLPLVMALSVVYVLVDNANRRRGEEAAKSATADTYNELHIPLFDAQGTPVADILAEEAEWNRTTGNLTFSKPVVYEYADGHLVRRTTGDSGYARTRTGAPSIVTVRGHVKVRCWNREEERE